MILERKILFFISGSSNEYGYVSEEEFKKSRAIADKARRK